jgi:hypothetical protein
MLAAAAAHFSKALSQFSRGSVSEESEAQTGSGKDFNPWEQTAIVSMHSLAVGPTG